jgi:hypothetical protein
MFWNGRFLFLSEIFAVWRKYGALGFSRALWRGCGVSIHKFGRCEYNASLVGPCRIPGFFSSTTKTTTKTITETTTKTTF